MPFFTVKSICFLVLVFKFEVNSIDDILWIFFLMVQHFIRVRPGSAAIVHLKTNSS